MDETGSGRNTGRTPWKIFRVLGPAIIVASVVLGPGSILTASRVGTEFGYGMNWVLAVATVLMIGMVALSARLGALLDGTIGDELTRRIGRPFAALIGVTVFLIVACFQSSNNVAVLTAIEPFLQEAPVEADSPAAESPLAGSVLPAVVLAALNIIIVAVLYGLRKLYRPIERLMMILVMVMIVAFLVNLLRAQPSVLGILKGLAPWLPAEAQRGLLPYETDGGIEDPLWALTGLLGTTFSVAGAYYQAYLVREKGWGIKQVRAGLIDSVTGIALLGGITLVVISTSAAVLRGRVAPGELETAADVAQQLEPMFGAWAKLLFSVGIFAGAFSSFLVNAMIGGTVLADGLGLGGRMDSAATRGLTTLALLAGMGVAIAGTSAGFNSVGIIVFAQALTVLGIPLLAATMLYLATRPELRGERRIPAWLKIMAAVGLAVSLLLALRTAWRLAIQLT